MWVAVPAFFLLLQRLAALASNKRWFFDSGVKKTAFLALT